MSSGFELKTKHQGDRNELLATVWLMDRGFEVYRNVSSRGPIDIIALRGQEIYKLDVKKCQKGGSPPLTPEQRSRGVQLLVVYDDGHCEIVPISSKPLFTAKYAACRQCNEKFYRKAKRKIFCSGKCSGDFHAPLKTRSELTATPKDF